jgi:hypothetical protein
MELGSSQAIFKIRPEAVRIKIDREDMLVDAVWLVVGRPGYFVHKEDSSGQKEDWKEPFCLCCGAYSTIDHMESPVHLKKVAEATWNVNAKGYGEVLQWIEDEAEEVIHLRDSPPPKRPTDADSDSGDDDARGLPQPSIAQDVRIVPQIAFADWPFELLEVDLSTKKKPDNWDRMDLGMAQAIRTEAQKGATKFRIVYGKTTKWTYEIDFADWSQLNVGTGTKRKLRFGVL